MHNIITTCLIYLHVLCCMHFVRCIFFLVADVSYHAPVSLIFKASKIVKHACKSAKQKMSMMCAYVYVDCALSIINMYVVSCFRYFCVLLLHKAFNFEY